MTLHGTLTYQGINFAFIYDGGDRLCLKVPERDCLAVQNWLDDQHRVTLPERHLSGEADGQTIHFALKRFAHAELTADELRITGVRVLKAVSPAASRVYLLLSAACLIVFLVVSWNIIAYLADRVQADQASKAMRDAYYAGAAPTVPVTDAPTSAPITPTPQAAASPAVSPESQQPTVRPNAILNAVNATEAPLSVLPQVAYPGNPYGVINERFAQVRVKNRDVVGWLTIPGLLDQAVVQRDNTYYLSRDYTGSKNVNGAIFLDQYTELTGHRPYALSLYGHNMKTGAMFGALRNYENLTFYKNNALITFDSLYEDGRYVIFAVSTVSTDALADNCLDFGALNSRIAGRRQQAITVLKATSSIHAPIAVAPTDQLLLLITCVDDPDERRIVAARRIREGESETALLELARTASHR